MPDTDKRASLLDHRLHYLKWCLHRRENITCCCCCQRWLFEKMGGFLLKLHCSAKSLDPKSVCERTLRKGFYVTSLAVFQLSFLRFLVGQDRKDSTKLFYGCNSLTVVSWRVGYCHLLLPFVHEGGSLPSEWSLVRSSFLVSFKHARNFRLGWK